MDGVGGGDVEEFIEELSQLCSSSLCDILSRRVSAMSLPFDPCFTYFVSFGG